MGFGHDRPDIVWTKGAFQERFHSCGGVRCGKKKDNIVRLIWNNRLCHGKVGRRENERTLVSCSVAINLDLTGPGTDLLAAKNFRRKRGRKLARLDYLPRQRLQLLKLLKLCALEKH